MENIYELLLEEDDILEESVRGKVGLISRKIKDLFNLQKKWNNNTPIKIYENKDMPEKTYRELVAAIEACHAENDNFNEYKKHFNKICSITGIASEHSVIRRCEYKEKKGKFWVRIKWDVSPKKIVIPNGHRLYHYTQAHFTEMNPTFKTKPPMPCLYSSPRCYFTIHKEMPMYCADIRTKERREKTLMVTPKENIRTAWIDPLILNYSMGAVFVETRLPIKVVPTSNTHIEREQTKLANKKAREEKRVKKESVDEEPVFSDMIEFMEYYGLEFAEDEFDEEFEESLASTLGTISRKIGDKLGMKKSWDKMASSKSGAKEISFKNEREKEKFKKDYSDMVHHKSYPIYKKAYESIRRFFGITDKNIVIENINSDKESANIKYVVAKPRKIIIPSECQLLHVSPQNNIKELEPTFRSKIKGKYMYPTKRVYFTIGKRIDLNKEYMGGLSKVFHYTPKENIRTAFIDPMCTDFSTGAIFVDTNFPIPVKQLERKLPSAIIKKESVDDIMNSINESFENKLITEEEKNILECKIIEQMLEDE